PLSGPSSGGPMSSDVYVVVEEPEPRGPAAYAAELIGTFLLVFFICGFISVSSAGGFDLAGLALAPAFVLVVAIYALGGTSGAHFNPAVTFALWWLKKINTPNAIAYVIFQCIGGILAGLVVLLFFNDVGDAVNYGATAINPEVLQGGSAWLGLLAE